MAPPLIAEVKQALRSVTLADAAAAAEQAVDAPDAATRARSRADRPACRALGRWYDRALWRPVR